ncbi:MAG: hypothetical protein K8R59_08175, partial [Thermoanaerobaculales bacterium]|nr:hypothetical protein [Thermoanaerobaculales bacterium]
FRIMPPSYPGDLRPESERYHRSARTWTKTFTRGLNRMTGGDEFIEGTVSISPEVFDHAVDTFGGGLVRFLEDGVDSLIKLGKSEEVPVRQIPFYRRLRYESSDYQVRGDYYGALDHIKRVRKAEKAYIKRGSRAELMRLRERHGGVLGMANDTQQRRLERQIGTTERDAQVRLMNRWLRRYYEMTEGD